MDNDVIAQLTDQIKKLQSKVKAQEGNNEKIQNLLDEIAILKERLNKKADFGEWD